MPKSSNPFEYRPEFTPRILKKVHKSTGVRSFLGFTLFDGLIEAGPNAELLSDLRLKILSRIALGQTYGLVSDRLDVTPWFVSSESNKTMAELGVKVHHAMLPAALKTGVLEVIAFADPGNFATTEQNIQTINKLANNHTTMDVAYAEDVKEHVIDARLHRTGIAVGSVAASC